MRSRDGILHERYVRVRASRLAHSRPRRQQDEFPAAIEDKARTKCKCQSIKCNSKSLRASHACSTPMRVGCSPEFIRMHSAPLPKEATQMPETWGAHAATISLCLNCPALSKVNDTTCRSTFCELRCGILVLHHISASTPCRYIVRCARRLQQWPCTCVEEMSLLHQAIASFLQQPTLTL